MQKRASEQFQKRTSSTTGARAIGREWHIADNRGTAAFVRYWGNNGHWSARTLVASIARGRRWLDELISDPSANAETIAARESCSIRKVNMMISLAFLAPHLVKAAIEGKLPRGMGVVRLCDLPAEWSRQDKMLGLIPQ